MKRIVVVDDDRESGRRSATSSSRGLRRRHAARPADRAGRDDPRRPGPRDPRREHAGHERLGALRDPAPPVLDARSPGSVPDRTIGGQGPHHRDAARRLRLSRQAVRRRGPPPQSPRRSSRNPTPWRKNEDQTPTDVTRCRPAAEPTPAERPRRPSRWTSSTLRHERIVYDGVTGLPIHPFETPSASTSGSSTSASSTSRSASSSASRSSTAGSSYDRVLVAVADGLQDDVGASRLAPHVRSIRFSGADGFFVLFDLPPAARAPSRRPRGRSRAAPGRRRPPPAPDLRRHDGGPHERARLEPRRPLDNPRVRPSRHLVRTPAEAVKIVTQRQTREKLDLCPS